MLRITGDSDLGGEEHTVSFEHLMDSLTDLKYVNIQRMEKRTRIMSIFHLKSDLPE